MLNAKIENLQIGSTQIQVGNVIKEGNGDISRMQCTVWCSRVHVCCLKQKSIVYYLIGSCQLLPSKC